MNDFSVNGNNIKIIDNHPWTISSGRRKKIDAIYNDFSLEKNYGIKVMERIQGSRPMPMYEPWMLRSTEDEPGTIDFKLREHVDCGDCISSRIWANMMMTLFTARLQDF